MHLKMNIHPLERIIRIGVGAFLVSLAFWGPNNLWYLLGAIPLVTGLIGWCPAYALLGFSTCKINLSIENKK